MNWPLRLPQQGHGTSPEQGHSETVNRGGRGSVAMRRSLKTLLVVGALSLSLGAAPAFAGLGLVVPGSGDEAVQSLGRLREVRLRSEWRLRDRRVPLDAHRRREGRLRQRVLRRARRRTSATRSRFRPGASATTAPMCISLFSGNMRFFTANAGSSKLEAEGAGSLQRRRRRPPRPRRRAARRSLRSATSPQAGPGSPAPRSRCSAAPCPCSRAPSSSASHP